MNILIFYLTIINVLTFVLFGVDKWKAIHDKWRIPEKTLLSLALLGGSVGGILGMRIFRHKTKHTIFKIGLPTIFIIHLVVLIYLKNQGIL